MGLFAKKVEGENFLVPAGTYVARCYGVVDIGTQFSEMFNKSIHQIALLFEIPSERTEKENKPLGISKIFTLSLHEKAELRHVLDSWVRAGKPFTEQELLEVGFDLKQLLGKACMLTVTSKVTSAGKDRSVIAAITGLPKGTVAPEQENPTAYYEVEQKRDATFEALPTWLKTFIARSEEFGGKGANVDTSDDSSASDTSVPFGDEDLLGKSEPEPPELFFISKTQPPVDRKAYADYVHKVMAKYGVQQAFPDELVEVMDHASFVKLTGDIITEAMLKRNALKLGAAATA
jgi:hypothetical protein